MPRTSYLPAEICSNNHMLSIPTDGRWAWDEKKKGLIYQSGNGMNHREGWHSNGILKIDLRTGRPHQRIQHRTLQQIIKTKDSNSITLVDTIQAAVNVMSEMFYIPIEFEEYLRRSPVHEFLLHLLNYFYWFFETMNNAVPRTGQHIDRSEMEKSRIRTAYAHLLAALRELACKYAVLLLGIDLKDFHHMRNGDLFYSCTGLDRTIFESLFIFSTYFTWITFYRQHFDLIRMELARLFRAGGDTELLKIPGTESLEDRVKKNVSHGLIARYNLIDCTEVFSKLRAEKEASEATKEISKRTSSMFEDLKGISHESNLLMKQSRAKIGLPSLSAKDSNTKSFHAVKFSGRSRKRQLRSSERVIDKQRIRSMSGLKEREKSQRERLTMRRLLTTSFQNNLSILPVPANPLDGSRKDKERPSKLPEVHFQLMQNLGILGKPYSDFDLIRLVLKPSITDNITIPFEFLITLPTQT